MKEEGVVEWVIVCRLTSVKAISSQKQHPLRWNIITIIIIVPCPLIYCHPMTVKVIPSNTYYVHISLNIILLLNVINKTPIMK